MVAILIAVALAGEPDIVAYAAVSRAERAERLAEEKAQQDTPKESASAIESPLIPYYARRIGINFRSGAVGQISWIDDEEIRVIEIIDDDEVLASYHWQVELDKPYLSTRAGRSRPGVYDDRERGLWIRGVSTKGLSDGALVPLVGVFAITGTKQYESDEGMETVPLLEPVDVSAHEKLFTREDEAREWVSAGGHKTRAIYDGYTRGAANLLKMDGQRIRVPLAKLSEPDRKFVLERNAKTRQAEKRGIKGRP